MICPELLRDALNFIKQVERVEREAVKLIAGARRSKKCYRSVGGNEL